jgi:hypothetical protein
MRVLLIGGLAALAVPAVLAGGVLGASAKPAGQSNPLRLSISRAGLTERATLGSFCRQGRTTDGGSTGSCGDAAYPLPTHGRLPVEPGSRLILRPGVEPRHVNVHLIRSQGTTFTPIGRKLDVKRLAAHRWAVELPARLRGAHLLDVSLRFKNPRDGQGDADFWGAIRQSCG